MYIPHVGESVRIKGQLPWWLFLVRWLDIDAQIRQHKGEIGQVVFLRSSCSEEHGYPVMVEFQSSGVTCQHVYNFSDLEPVGDKPR